MNPNHSMSKADRKELKADLDGHNFKVPEDQHCQRCGEVKDSVDYVRGNTEFDYLCNKCLQEVEK